MKSNEICPCPRLKCARYGNCDDCKKHHTKSIPYCERIAGNDKKRGSRKTAAPNNYTQKVIK